MKIEGTGIISPAGRGMQAQKATDALTVESEMLKDKTVLKNMRRADRFSKMACLAAHDALTSSTIELTEGSEQLGIIVTTTLGPHATTFKFLDDVIDYGDTEVSPTKFSHSVHNAAASYIALAIGSRGPTSTVTNFTNPLSDGIALGSAWLQTGRAKYVLVGYIEEISEPFEYITEKLLSNAIDRLSFSFEATDKFTEGAVFFLLGNGDGNIDMETIKDIKSIIEVV